MRGYAVAFFVGGVFTISTEWTLLMWQARREVKRHGQSKFRDDTEARAWQQKREEQGW